jgi:glutamine amidotransferase
MCRHLAYLGPPQPLSWALLDAPHALTRQSWAPREMRGGATINADGYGFGWYPGDGRDPVRYRRATPMWSDLDLAGLAAASVSGCLLAAVRSATAGMPVTSAAVAPFACGPWLFSHNGVVTGWPHSVAGLAGRLPVTDLLTLDAPTDSALLWALVRDRLRAGTPPGEALAATVADVSSAAPGSRLNLLLTDGHTIAATAAGHSLAVRAEGSALLVSSEALDGGPAWQPVPDRSLIVATAGGIARTPLGEA